MKNLTKKWWFWLIIIAVIFIILWLPIWECHAGLIGTGGHCHTLIELLIVGGHIH